MSDKPKSRQRWYQFSLRTLLVLVAILSITAVAVERYQEWQRRERARIQFEKTMEIYDPVRIVPSRIQ